MTAPETPYTATWAQEADTTPPVIMRRCPRGYPWLAFRGELPHDRDRHGILWRRQTTAPGRGPQLTGRVHSYRQRRAMDDLLCHVDAISAVGGHALRDGPPHISDQALFLLSCDDVREGHITAVPPVCCRCAPRVAGARGRQRRQLTAVLVAEVRPWGVVGLLHDPTSVPLRPAGDGGLVPVRYRSAQARWVVAHQALVSLHGITPVRLRLRNTAA
ncbi:hypothetical protein [Streptomyces sp. NPDC059080]|uniref:hypothetical protein n=1 Tax=Streptomyces sp. NPDC059080 TaxID=3346718 RepID=UPI0036AD580E